jgi:hypothetical protein
MNPCHDKVGVISFFWSNTGTISERFHVFLEERRKKILHGAGHDKMNLTLEQADYSLAHPGVLSRAIDD